MLPLSSLFRAFAIDLCKPRLATTNYFNVLVTIFLKQLRQLHLIVNGYHFAIKISFFVGTPEATL